MRSPVRAEGLALALAAVVTVGCARRPLPVLGQVPQFQLMAESGEGFDSRLLEGHVWVADFIYTTCAGPCPMMSTRMNRLQRETASIPEVKLVSFTVDPEHDTPPVLAEYARHFKADPARWHFLTGQQPRLNDLGLAAFHLNPVDGKLEHSTRFVLVDGHGRIRGYYLSSGDDFLPKMLEDVRRLVRERQ